MNNLLEIIEKARIAPDLKKDQFFLIDEDVIKRVAELAKVTKKDRVLEVGAGLGFLTRELALRAKEVIAIEIDKRFVPILRTLPKNVEVIYGDAYRLLNDKSFLKKVKPPTKIISNIPYSQAQNMLHNYTNHTWYEGDLIWIAPMSLVNRVNNEPILGAYFTAEVMEIVPRQAFYPQPNTTSAIIYFRRIGDPKITCDFAVYFRRWLYTHEELKVKNALRECLIQAVYGLKGITITKNQARELVAKLQIPEEELDKLVSNIRPKYYFDIPEKLKSWFENLI